jgi:protein-S-isoprenylcysteine O-methyltransferase Ste14
MPEFTLSFLNAWLLTVFILIHPLIMQLLDRLYGNGDLYQKMGGEPEMAGKKEPISLPSILLVGLFLVSIFIPLKAGSLWLLVGLLIYLAGAAIFISSIITAARTQPGHIFSGGMYLFSRHPLYLSFLILFLGISLASASWLFLILSMAWMYFPLSGVAAEEQSCLETFGDEYKVYMKGTPKWLGFPKAKPAK